MSQPIPIDIAGNILGFVVGSVLIVSLVLYIALCAYAIIHTSYTLDDCRLTQEDKRALRRCLSDIIGVISRKIREPIAIYLHGTYPNTKRVENYAIIQSGQPSP